MPNDDPTLPRQQIQIVVKGYQFQLIMPYVEGHPITAAEAGVLNREWTESVRAGFVPQIERVIDESPKGLTHTNIQALQLEFQHFADEFQFKALLQSRNSDPVVKAAHAIAKKVLDIRLNSLGQTRQQYGESRYEAALSRLMNNHEIIKQAQKQVELTRSAANELVGLPNDQ